MRLNLVLACLFVVTLSFLSGVGHLIDTEFFVIVTALVLGTLVIMDWYGQRRGTFRMASWIGLGIFILFFVIVPMIGVISFRHSQQADAQLTHDNVIQMEEAVKFLKAGKNPYAENYDQTPLADYGGGKVYGVTNPALFHLINLPAHHAVTTAASSIITPLFGFYDERMLYILVYLALLYLAFRLGRTEVEKQRLVVLIGLNPLMIPFMVEGRNDVLILFVILAALLALHRRRRLMAAAIFALACSIKAFAWTIIPFFAVVLFVSGGATSRERLRGAVAPGLVALSIIAVFYLPFLLWNAPAFIDDVIRYPGGSLPTSYPIAGNGIGTSLMVLGIIKSNTASFPFWILQAVAVIPLLVIFLPRLYRRPEVSLLIFSGAIVAFANQYFGRYFHANHFGFILAMIAAGFAFLWLESHPSPPRP
ncbi:MAG: DUF2029 domain-containing protein [Candidatus Kerfeldbacteria bacterium]|nr:DUF2029 domain-containing protein [Candidatus Kerfeldbacteria bacterium]